MKFSIGFDKKENHLLKVSYTEPAALDIVSRHLYHIISEIPRDREIVIVCVGTDRSTGDSLGPLVGSGLMKCLPVSPIHVYGTLDEPVHAMNLKETMDTIERRFGNPYLIAVDACLGQLTSVGTIQVGQGPVKPGAGVNKNLPPVGDIHVTGIVNVGGFMEYFVLQNTRLSLVVKMAEAISGAIHKSSLLARGYTSAPYVKLDG